MAGVVSLVLLLGGTRVEMMLFAYIVASGGGGGGVETGKEHLSCAVSPLWINNGDDHLAM